jgi:hypothetical protein
VFGNGVEDIVDWMSFELIKNQKKWGGLVFQSTKES